MSNTEIAQDKQDNNLKYEKSYSLFSRFYLKPNKPILS